MRLPFSSRKGQETTDSSSRRSSVSEGNPRSQHNDGDDASSERSTGHANSASLDTPATSYSSYNSVTDHEAKRTGMYKLSGKTKFEFEESVLIALLIVVDRSGTFLPVLPLPKLSCLRFVPWTWC
jgi:hypothetical protein